MEEGEEAEEEEKEEWSIVEDEEVDFPLIITLMTSKASRLDHMMSCEVVLYQPAALDSG